jgi:hypothetical protein
MTLNTFVYPFLGTGGFGVVVAEKLAAISK